MSANQLGARKRADRSSSRRRNLLLAASFAPVSHAPAPAWLAGRAICHTDSPAAGSGRGSSPSPPCPAIFVINSSRLARSSLRQARASFWLARRRQTNKRAGRMNISQRARDYRPGACGLQVAMVAAAVAAAASNQLCGARKCQQAAPKRTRLPAPRPPPLAPRERGASALTPH